MDCALSLVRLGKERHIPGLQLLSDDLVTMETLVYETSCDLSLTLKELQQLSDIDKLHLLMKNVSAAISFLIRRPFGSLGTGIFSYLLDFKFLVSEPHFLRFLNLVNTHSLLTSKSLPSAHVAASISSY